jgi:hypothetical protein
MTVQALFPLTIDIAAQAPGGALLFGDDQTGGTVRPNVKDEPINIARSMSNSAKTTKSSGTRLTASRISGSTLERLPTYM